MKIAIVSSSDSGGAGIAALRLHKALMASGVDSSMLCLHKASDTPKVYEYKRSLFSKVIDHLPFIPHKQNKYKKHYPVLSECYECFSFPEAIYDISSHPLIQQADVVNLHWVGSSLDYSRFFKNVRKPIVWTLHDMNPFLGISHYYGDRDANLQFSSLEEKVRELKYEAISQHPNVSVVNLCHWMKDASEKSEALSNRRHTVIPNSIDINTFKIYDRTKIRRELSLPLDKPVLLFVSQSVKNKRKGFDLLQDALKGLTRDCVLLVVGGVDEELKTRDNCIFVGSVNNEQRMAMLYAASDAFILPSREDNLPNTMVESLCCGTPVISFSNGGMRDHIQTLKNGVLVEEMTAEALLEGINLFWDNASLYNRSKISENAHEVFSPTMQAKRYMDFFQSVL